jgi:hypothetical protein
MFKVKSDLMDKKKSNSTEKVKTPRPSLTESSDEEIFAFFLDEVHRMKREVLPLKHHMGIILLDILKETNSSKRTSFEELRNIVQGQYYTIIAQGKETFGFESKKKDTGNPDSSQQQEDLSASAKHSGIPDGLNFDFDLDYIVTVRRTKKVITIEDGDAQGEIWEL